MLCAYLQPVLIQSHPATPIHPFSAERYLTANNLAIEFKPKEQPAHEQGKWGLTTCGFAAFLVFLVQTGSIDAIVCELTHFSLLADF